MDNEAKSMACPDCNVVLIAKTQTKKLTKEVWIGTIVVFFILLLVTGGGVAYFLPVIAVVYFTLEANKETVMVCPQCKKEVSRL